MSSPEIEVHKAIVSWLGYALPADSLVHHSPNEGRHNVAWRAKQKRMGMQAGWPDLEIFVAPKHFKRPLFNFAPIFLEVKSDKGKLSKKQRAVLEKLRTLGAHAAVVRSIDDARAFLNEIIEVHA
tara:strand:- start:1921 stop:2295 length:375 start_codon:yes stop_codon:yes gene_type:complete